MSPTLSQRLAAILAADPERSRVLNHVAGLEHGEKLWIGAGFVRNAVWDFLHE